MSRIVIIGGHGKVALLTAPLLTQSGHEVTSVIRNADQSDDVKKTGAAPLVLDVESAAPDALLSAFADHDVVVWSAGAGGGSPERTFAVDRDAAIRTIDAAQKAGVARYVMVSYFGAGPDHGVPPDSSFFAYAQAKTDADEHLAASGLDHVILRPSGLTDDEPTGGIEWGEGVAPSQVSRGNVARVIAAVVDTGVSGAVRTVASPGVVAFNDGDRPISEIFSR